MSWEKTEDVINEILQSQLYLAYVLMRTALLHDRTLTLQVPEQWPSSDPVYIRDQNLVIALSPRCLSTQWCWSLADAMMTAKLDMFIWLSWLSFGDKIISLKMRNQISQNPTRLQVLRRKQYHLYHGCQNPNWNAVKNLPPQQPINNSLCHLRKHFWSATEAMLPTQRVWHD